MGILIVAFIVICLLFDQHAEITHRLVSSCMLGRKLVFPCRNGISLVICKVKIISHRDAGDLYVQTTIILIWQHFWKEIRLGFIIIHDFKEHYGMDARFWPFLRPLGLHKLLSNVWLKVNVSQGEQTYSWCCDYQAIPCQVLVSVLWVILLFSIFKCDSYRSSKKECDLNWQTYKLFSFWP